MPPSARSAIRIPTTLTCQDLGAAGAAVGTAFTNTLRWSPVPTPSSAYIVVTDSAADGMSFALNSPGIYFIDLCLLQLAATTLRCGLSLNGQPAAGVVMSYGTSGVFRLGGPSVAPAATQPQSGISTWIYIADSAVGAVLRTHATDNAGATPVGVLSTAVGANALRLAHIIDAA